MGFVGGVWFGVGGGYVLCVLGVVGLGLYVCILCFFDIVIGIELGVLLVCV